MLFQRLLVFIITLISYRAIESAPHTSLLTNLVHLKAIRMFIHLYHNPYMVVHGLLQFRTQCMGLHRLEWFINDKSRYKNFSLKLRFQKDMIYLLDIV